MIEIIGGNKISGEVEISGSKNTALPVICASLLTRGVVKLTNVPIISDVEVLLEIIKTLNVRVIFVDNDLTIDSTNIKYESLNNDLISKIRASSYLLSVMLVLFKKVEMSYPGGCNLGLRTLDYHFDAFKALGVVVKEDSTIKCEANIIKGTSILFKEKSVGATLNTIILSGLSHQIVKIYNYAKEPEVEHTIKFLKKIGYKIYEFKDYLLIAGSHKLKKKIKFRIPFDRIEAISYIMLGLKSEGVTIKHVNPNELSSVLKALDKIDANYKIDKTDIFVKKNPLKGIDLVCSNYPSFPTDAGPLIVPILLDSESESTLKDNIYPERFNYVKSLSLMKGNIFVKDKILHINPSSLEPAIMKGYDLRGVFSLIIAASTVNGKSTILDGDIALRGYESLILKLKKLGIEANLI